MNKRDIAAAALIAVLASISPALSHVGPMTGSEMVYDSKYVVVATVVDRTVARVGAAGLIETQSSDLNVGTMGRRGWRGPFPQPIREPAMPAPMPRPSTSTSNPNCSSRIPDRFPLTAGVGVSRSSVSP